MFAFGPAHTSYNPGESTIGVGNVATLQEAWTATLGPPQGGSVTPVTAGGMVYATSDASPFKLEAFDAGGTTGCTGGPTQCTPLWTATLGAAPLSLDVGNGFVYVTAFSGTLLAFDANGITGCSGSPKTCHKIWQVIGVALAQPAVTDTFVYSQVGARVAAFDAKGVTNCSGTPKSCAPVFAVDGSAPAAANGVLYVSRVASTFEVRAYDAAGSVNCSGTHKRCTPLWVGNTGIHPDVIPHVTAPTISNGVVWIGIDNGDEIGNGGSVVGFDASGTSGCSGNPKVCNPTWRAATDGGVVSPPAVAGNVVYALQSFHSGDVEVTTRNTLSAFSFSACHSGTSTCAPLWKFALGGTPQGLAIANGLVFVSSEADQRVSAVDAAGVNGCSGAPRVCTPLKTITLTGAPTGPIVADGVVFVGTRDDNVLHAYELP
jgi:hypothetical protein